MSEPATPHPPVHQNAEAPETHDTRDARETVATVETIESAALDTPVETLETGTPAAPEAAAVVAAVAAVEVDAAAPRVAPVESGENTATVVAALPSAPARTADEAPASPEAASPVAPADPMEGVPTLLADAMRKRGFQQITSVQRAVLEADSEGRDLRVSSQTGSGKTVAIGLALHRHLSEEDAGRDAQRHGPSVLVLVPTRELATQVSDELRWLYGGIRNLRVEVVIGGTSLSQERRALDRRPRIVVGTPGRTLDHLRTGALKAQDVEHVILDESDRMLDMGFREELEAILEELPSQRRTHMVSATFPNSVRKLADRFQNEVLAIEGTRLGAANSDIEHVAHVLDRREFYPAIVNSLLLNDGGRCLIFVERRIDASALSGRLSADGFPVQYLSGELAQAQRTRTLEAFRDGTIKTLVSTDVAARGIDVPDIELVIHADPPGDADSFVHRSGRTGRAGRTGRSVVLVPTKARRHVTRLFGAARVKPEWRPAPSASKVRKQLRKRFRHQLHERLNASVENLPTQQQIDYAKGLLDGRDPAAVVSLLLELAEPAPAREPMNLSAAATSTPSPEAVDAASPGYVRFTINWGERNGAAPNRLLGHICRRGQVAGRLVGGIEIGPDESSFEVVESAAARFEKLVQRTDARDPHLHIHRAGRGSSGGGSADSDRHGPKRGGPKKPFRARERGRDSGGAEAAAPGKKGKKRFRPRGAR